MEIFLYLTGQNQISTAKSLFGVSDEQKTNPFPWVAVILAASIESCEQFMPTLEEFLGIPLESGQNWVAHAPIDEIISALDLSPTYLEVMSQVAGDIPLLPAPPNSPEEIWVIQALLEKMVTLSIGQVKSGF
jgi:hypothetical protein